jgi:8-oxo-dGTP diphosphatase
MTRGIIALVSRCKITGGALATPDDTAAFRWVDEADITDLADEAYAIRVLEALADSGAPAIRQHDGRRLM